jgi:Zn finger protein HypA/HybF involved in hydrogenase expression
MTHDAPGESTDRRWCEQCQLSVEPVASDDGLTCPACGADLGSATD